MGHTGLEMIHVLCSLCHKNNAVISYTEVINGIKKEQFLCSECAKKYTAGGAGMGFSSPAGLLAGLLASVLGQTDDGLDDSEIQKTNLKCPECGMTYNEFLKYSKFGCSQCVRTFGFVLDGYLKKIQGSCEHCGKQYPGPETVTLRVLEPEENSASEKISASFLQSDSVQAEDKNGDSISRKQALRDQLKAAVEAEEYELAAKLRDEIRTLENREKAGESSEEMV